VGMQDLKIKNGSSTELFDCQTYLKARFWNFFTHKLTKTVAEGINRVMKGLKWSQMAGLWLPQHGLFYSQNPPKMRLPKLSISFPKTPLTHEFPKCPIFVSVLTELSIITTNSTI